MPWNECDNVSLRVMSHARSLNIVIVFLAAFDCSLYPSTEVVQQTTDESNKQLQAYVDLADIQAIGVLKEADQSSAYGDMGGPFHLSDYERTVSEERFQGRQVVVVCYDLSRPVAFDGGLQHCGVWIYKDTGKT